MDSLTGWPLATVICVGLICATTLAIVFWFSWLEARHTTAQLRKETER